MTLTKEPLAPQASTQPLTRAEKGEKIGSGIIICKRDAKGRLIGSHRPFEHPSHAAAIIETARLSGLYPGQEFVVLAPVARVLDGGQKS